MILFVDDERRHMDAYARSLTDSGHTVMFQHNVDAALKFITANLAEIELLILDIMMPPGLSFKEDDTEFGIMTGIRFYERVRRQAPDLHVIILTNVSDEQAAKRFSDQNNCLFLRKVDYLPYELVQTVNAIITNNK